MGVAPPALAETPAGSFSWVRATGADTCPAREKVAAELDRALGKPLVDALEGRAVEGVIVRGKGGWDVTLYWRAADGTAAGTREIHDDSAGCDAVARSVVTSITVALTAGAVDARSLGTAAPTVAPAPPPPPPVTSKQLENKPSTAAPTASVDAGAPPPDPEAGAPESRTHAGGVMLGGVVTLGWLPGIGYGMQLVAEPIVSGRFRIQALAAALAETAQRFPGVTAGVSAIEFGGDLCTTLLSHPRRLIAAAVCGGGRAGAIQTSVYSGLTNSGGSRGSFAVELGAELRSNPLGPVTVALSVNSRLNVTRYQLDDAAGKPLFTQDLIGFVSSLRMGLQFF